MPYKGTEVSIGEMLDELIRNGRDDQQAATELRSALRDFAITLEFNGAPLSFNQIAGVSEYISLAAARNAREIRLRLGWLTYIITDSKASRSQFETVCGIVSKDDDG